MTSERDGLARSVQVRLARHAREIGVDPNLVLTRFGVERFLYRLSRSRHADRFVLKGALLLLAWLGESLRPTRDADLLGFGELSDGELRAIFGEVCAVAVEPDATTFDAGSIRVAPIRETDAYGGRRVSLSGKIGLAQLRIQVDVGIGDAVTPAPVWLDYPSLLEFPAARLRAYTRETVLAEKLHALVLLGNRNSRMKDFFDLFALVREGAVDAETLARAVAATFERRQTVLPAALPVGLTDEFAHDPAKERQWTAFLSKNGLVGPDLGEVVRAIRAFSIPALLRRTDPRGG